MTEQRNGLTARPEDIKMVPVTKIKPAEYNPRKDLVPKDKAYQKIAASMLRQNSPPQFPCCAESPNLFKDSPKK